jgi:uncharacterized protein
MRWRSSRRSGNVQDRRGMAGGVGLGGGVTLLIVLVVWLLGGDPGQVLQLLNGGTGAPVEREAGPPPADDETAQFLSAVLGMTEDVWGEIFAEAGSTYPQPTLVLFSDAVRSACGSASSATGPFYCPPDRTLYLDTHFFSQLARMGGAGDFARAYVIGHEVGHHVQNVVGTLDQANRRQAAASSEAEANRIQVLVELQADCYAGVWAHHANRRERVLEPGDVEEGLSAAAAIGDDRIARRSGRDVTPESFTHGSSEQRTRWLRTGLDSGDVDACDTFAEGV